MHRFFEPAVNALGGDPPLPNPSPGLSFFFLLWESLFLFPTLLCQEINRGKPAREDGVFYNHKHYYAADTLVW
ncbi:hypothetical protein DFJ73DRAFT_817383 [Zopfochytrium polystomum]|nr:hypothetical protein DFJ73DRAFT_817383 [Zopfochytrium polystomum]